MVSKTRVTNTKIPDMALILIFACVQTLNYTYCTAHIKIKTPQLRSSAEQRKVKVYFFFLSFFLIIIHLWNCYFRTITTFHGNRITTPTASCIYTYTDPYTGPYTDTYPYYTDQMRFQQWLSHQLSNVCTWSLIN